MKTSIWTSLNINNLLSGLVHLMADVAHEANIHWGGFAFIKKVSKGQKKKFTIGQIDYFTYLYFYLHIRLS